MSSYLFIVSLLKLLLYYKMMKGDWRQKSYTKGLVSASSILAHLQQLTRQLTAASVTKIVIATISRKCVTFTFYESDKKSFVEAKGVLVQKPLSLNNRVSYLFLGYRRHLSDGGICRTLMESLPLNRCKHSQNKHESHSPPSSCYTLTFLYKKNLNNKLWTGPTCPRRPETHRANFQKWRRTLT